MSNTSSALPPTPAGSPTINPPTVSTVEDPPKPEPGAAPSATAAQIPAATGTLTPKDHKVPNDDEEPQNPLTKKFTEQEWTALKELRVRSYKPKHYSSSLTCLSGTETNP